MWLVNERPIESDASRDLEGSSLLRSTQRGSSFLQQIKHTSDSDSNWRTPSDRNLFGWEYMLGQFGIQHHLQLQPMHHIKCYCPQHILVRKYTTCFSRSPLASSSQTQQIFSETPPHHHQQPPLWLRSAKVLRPSQPSPSPHRY